MTTTILSEILRGVRADRPQTVGLMQLIPLIGEVTDERFAPVSTVEMKTSHYGTMVFKNTDDTRDLTIIPQGGAFIVPQAAQDHTTTSVVIVKGKREVQVNNAACIQQSQGGTISAGKHSITFLPLPIREAALFKRAERGFDRLWTAIGQFNRLFGLGSGGNLVEFTRQFDRQLAVFVAEFEPVEGQVGAIILINGKVVGIERTPNQEYWLSVWKAVVREGYGSLAILEARQATKPQPMATRQAVTGPARNLAEIRAALTNANTREGEAVAQVIRALGAETFTTERDENNGEFIVETLTNPQYVGQIVTDRGTPVYASLMATEARRLGKGGNAFVI